MTFLSAMEKLKMPNRQGHTWLTLGLLVPVAALSSFYPSWTPIGVGIIATLPFKIGQAKIYFNPDMDIAASDSWITDALGLDAYRSEIGHRAGLRKKDWATIKHNPLTIFMMSHLPFFGTLPRFIPALFVLILLSSIIPIHAWVYIGVYIGMGLSDTVHVAADVIWSSVKRKGRSSGLNRTDNVGDHRNSGGGGSISIQGTTKK